MIPIFVQVLFPDGGLVLLDGVVDLVVGGFHLWVRTP